MISKINQIILFGVKNIMKKKVKFNLYYFLVFILVLFLILILHSVFTFNSFTNAAKINPSMSLVKINNILTSNNKVIFQKGLYKIDTSIGIRPKSNQEIIFEDGVIIKANPSSSQSYKIIYLYKLKNVKIIGGKIIGDRYNHNGKIGQWGMGVSIISSSNITISKMSISNCWGDGIYLGASRNGFNSHVAIDECIINNNRRQGISVISAVNLVVSNTKIMNTNGNNPQAGIDFEPNYPTQRLEKITIQKLYTYNTKGTGIMISATKIPYIDIMIKDHYHDGGKSGSSGLYINFAQINQSGSITVVNPTYVSTNNNPVVFKKENLNSASVHIINLSTKN